MGRDIARCGLNVKGRLFDVDAITVDEGRRRYPEIMRRLFHKEDIVAGGETPGSQPEHNFLFRDGLHGVIGRQYEDGIGYHLYATFTAVEGSTIVDQIEQRALDAGHKCEPYKSLMFMEFAIERLTAITDIPAERIECIGVDLQSRVHMRVIVAKEYQPWDK